MRDEVNKAKVAALMEALGRSSRGPGRIYLTGGATALLQGWRDTTVDLDIKMDPEPSGIFDALPRLKEELNFNIELASPEQFIPALPGWQDRSEFIGKFGQVEFFHYDYYAQALAKLERYHSRDRSDVDAMIARELIKRERLMTLFEAIEPGLNRYPAIEPASFRARVEHVVRGEGK